MPIDTLVQHHFLAYDLVQMMELQVLYACLKHQNFGKEFSPLAARVFSTMRAAYSQRYGSDSPITSQSVYERSLVMLGALTQGRGYNRYLDAMYMWGTNPTF